MILVIDLPNYFSFRCSIDFSLLYESSSFQLIEIEEESKLNSRKVDGLERTERE